MKKVIIACCIVFSAVMSQAQSWNPYVNQGIVSSAMLPSEFGGTGEISFNIGNTGSDPLAFDQKTPENNLSLVITLKNGIPSKNNPLAAISGKWKRFFDWSYDASNKTYTAIQIKTIPESDQGTLTFEYKVSDNSAYTAAANGFMVKLKAPAYSTGANNAQDDVVSSYSYTKAYDFGDAPMSYGSARHEINVLKDDATGQYLKYIYLGKKVDQEPDVLISTKAQGDDSSESDDEDGVSFPSLVAGSTAEIPVEVTAKGESYGILNAWFDWNGDGDFNDAEEKASGTPMAVYSTGTYVLSVDIPADANTEQPTFARFRIGANSGSSAPNAWGEVEDYEIVIQKNDLMIPEIHAGIIDSIAGLTINIYPNPVSNYYNITIDKPGNYNVELMDINGKMVYKSIMSVSSNGNETKQFYRDANVIAGNYFIRVIDKEKGSWKTVKVILAQ